ncbi:MAG: phosphoribosylamine--glycine ligase [Nitrospira sp. SB0677_bin_15]|nr:phosphoribosylamine--glycine ligase [Nitrospira sp. SB0667_bin_9]MYD31736.1 phosphoribosylamine--glycine ligase [Nitrospira sp. SB0661_bin_20]MYG40605.1 phosphoribosylamine--glycine ligase [Nitrospira sp. SB0677_bin_15]MYH01632.1 phosphoribosylamine--glycine ligase [Nitrospira sp. SB0675_bin_23]MYJ23385.1 phosphoribosylamine--glycine ligase [Nitrospira sp. SB0673_bin_12]
MKILVIGGGGREHALVWKLASSHRVSKLYCAPGNAGISQLATCVPLAATDLAGLKTFAEQEAVDLTVVGPEAPLALGIADLFRENKLKVFGPTRNAAKIESSKAFAKNLMMRQGIPTAEASTFESVRPALDYLEQCALPIVVKADGLAQGKGVVVARTAQDAKDAVVNVLERRAFGDAGNRVVIEECLEGEELTLMAFADGKTVVPMLAAQDHKRLGEGDTGPNTGGMGAYAPAPLATPALRYAIMRDVLHPAIEGLSRVGSPFYGVLYAGVMVKDGTPYVLEFNARFGDPETQVVLPLLKTDLADVLEAVVEHRLDQVHLDWSEESSVCVVMASGGYPGTYPTGLPINGLLESVADDRVSVFHAGTALNGQDVVTAGGRVLGVTAWGPSLKAARDRAYDAGRHVTFEGQYFRTDIAARVLT